MDPPVFIPLNKMGSLDEKCVNVPMSHYLWYITIMFQSIFCGEVVLTVAHLMNQVPSEILNNQSLL